MQPTTKRQTILAEFLNRVWTGGDIEACGDFLADGYRIAHDPGDPWEGRTLDLDGFKERVRLSRAPFPDQRFDVQAWFEADDKIAVTWMWSATHLGDLPDFPATGRRLTMSGATVYFFSGDRLSGHWQVTDRLGIFRQLRSGG